jgi:hypothetical protein
MSKFLNAADALERLAKQHQLYADAAAELTQVGSLIQAAFEAEKQIADARFELDAVKAQIAGIEADTAAAQQMAKTLVDEAKENAKQTKLKANALAAEVEQKAKAKADALVADAQARASATLMQAATVLHDAKAQAGIAETEAAAARADMTAMQSELAAAQAQLEEIRAKVRNLIG